MSTPNELCSCESCERQLGGYMDGYLDEATSRMVAGHLEECKGCTRQLESMRESRDRMRAAVRSVKAPPALAVRIRGEMTSRPRRHSWNFGMTFAVATCALALGVFLLDQIVELRLNNRAQDVYISWISNGVNRVMGIGLKDHVHCAYFRKYPKDPPPIEKVAQDLDVSYRELIPAMKENLPSSYQVELAHQCRYQGRKYIHLVARTEGNLVSLVIAEKGEGESFRNNNLLPLVRDLDTPIYEASARSFQIAGFESSRHLVFVISDMQREDNVNVLTAMAPRVRRLLESPGS